jgi:hypothetical protein
LERFCDAGIIIIYVEEQNREIPLGRDSKGLQAAVDGYCKFWV